MKNLKILIVDDHPLILEGLKSAFTVRGYTNIHKANNGLKALQYLSESLFDVVILDIDMPKMSGMEVVKHIQDIPTKSIILTHHKENGYIIQAKLLGANAYLLKDDSFQEVEKAVREIQDNKFYLSSSFKDEKLEQLDAQIKLLKNLSLAEQQVLKRISEGFETAEVATILAVSKRTIHKHRSNIIQKLDLPSDRNALANYAQKNKQLIKEIFS